MTKFLLSLVLLLLSQNGFAKQNTCTFQINSMGTNKSNVITTLEFTLESGAFKLNFASSNESLLKENSFILKAFTTLNSKKVVLVEAYSNINYAKIKKAKNKIKMGQVILLISEQNQVTLVTSPHKVIRLTASQQNCF